MMISTVFLNANKISTKYQQKHIHMYCYTHTYAYNNSILICNKTNQEFSYNLAFC